VQQGLFTPTEALPVSAFLVWEDRKVAGKRNGETGKPSRRLVVEAGSGLPSKHRFFFGADSTQRRSRRSALALRQCGPLPKQKLGCRESILTEIPLPVTEGLGRVSKFRVLTTPSPAPPPGRESPIGHYLRFLRFRDLGNTPLIPARTAGSSDHWKRTLLQRQRLRPRPTRGPL